MSFNSIPEALEAFKNGEFLVVMDDEGRENEGDLIIAAEHLTTEKAAFLVKYSSGLVCAPMSCSRADELDLPLMVPSGSDRHGTAYTLTTDYIHGTTTGISAHDRSLTISKFADPSATSADFMRPGHVLPLRARDGGVLERRGHTEAAVDLCKLSGCYPAAAICEITADDGSIAKRDFCLKFAAENNLKIITIDALAEYLSKLQK
ncbi:hypothetical protein CANCADRAFT_87084 [Tortispora caseinolytica NRRL Y-17796]|uniref:3,4-dihydroxy-2-butanone 4-phosphate synthase n=1 Tax=Tortispora caseinolytica NRRL Y-17796 TaxID=767744 RepID=A0A1E4TL42_9ASCO|nr:hypothetical protein CANCADRAFT_87084 [Tortispora caseinolytica NRRL Y-17796]